MKRRVKGLLAVMLSLSMCFSQGVELLADEVSDNVIEEETVQEEEMIKGKRQIIVYC